MGRGIITLLPTNADSPVAVQAKWHDAPVSPVEATRQATPQIPESPTLHTPKDGAPSGADELGVELAKWYHPDAPWFKLMRKTNDDRERVGHPPGAQVVGSCASGGLIPTPTLTPMGLACGAASNLYGDN